MALGAELQHSAAHNMSFSGLRFRTEMLLAASPASIGRKPSTRSLSAEPSVSRRQNRSRLSASAQHSRLAMACSSRPPAGSIVRRNIASASNSERPWKLGSVASLIAADLRQGRRGSSANHVGAMHCIASARSERYRRPRGSPALVSSSTCVPSCDHPLHLKVALRP